jgi:4-diphosphocytidyl-2-C-methyl-D-erythritol kinase
MLPPSFTREHPCPAKVNLQLAVTGRRADGFHNLVSVVAPIELSDQLLVSWDPSASVDQIEFAGMQLEGTDSTVGKALQLFRRQIGLSGGGFQISITKHIPSGGGLGGGSSDAVGLLQVLTERFGVQDDYDWPALSLHIGSDCPLFWPQMPVLMSGRGECIEPLPKVLWKRFCGHRLILFKPGFGISTPEAFARLATHGLYDPEVTREAVLETWEASGARLPPGRSTFERLMAIWMPTFPLVLREVSALMGEEARLSGSGSTCFVIAPEEEAINFRLRAVLKAVWGHPYSMMETRLK